MLNLRLGRVRLYRTLDSVQQQPEVEKTVDSANEENKVGEITKELTDERTSDSKKFQKDDGSYEFAQYQVPVHYLENGKWEDIDNTLEEVVTKDKNGNTNKVLQNKQNDFKIKISKDSTAKNLIELQKDKYGVSWNLVNTQSTVATAVDSDENKLDEEIKKNVDAQISQDKDLKKADPKVKNDIKNILIQNEERKTAKKVTSIAVYPNIYKNTDLQYILKGSDIKENIVINKKSDIKEFTFKLNTTNVVPKLQEDKTIIFYDSNDTSRAVFKMQAPFMYDKGNNVSDNININLNQTNEGYVLSLIPDKDWLNSNDRKYPIIIDPSLQTSLASTSIYDTFVAANDTQNKRLNQFVRVGKSSTIGLTRTYIKFTLPQLTSGDMITNASLNLLYCAGVSSNTQVSPINVHKVTQDFDPDNLYWSNQPSYDSRIESFSLVGDSGQDSWEQWDITSIAKQWFTSGNNYGLMLEQDNGGGYSSFYSSDMDNTYAWARPQVTFSYINNSGLESYWTYHSQDVGRAGTSYVNDYNGNLVFLRNDIDMNGNRMPVSISHVFNSNDRKAANVGYGNGWRLNLNQRLERQDIGGTQYYKYTDADGTKHYFKDSSATEMNDELNLGLTLIKETNGSLSIKDKQSTKLNFNASTNDLNTITDANGNTMSFIYGATSISGVRNLTKVIDGAGRAVTLNYYSTFNVLQSIQDTAGNLAVKNDFVNNILYKYTYDISDRLVNVLESNGNELSYNYDQNNNLSSVIDKIGSSTHATNYSYDNDNRLIKTTKGSSEYSNNYDKLGRLTNTSINTGSTQYNVNYTYLPGSMASNIGVSFDGYVENSGWQGIKTDGEVSGTVGSSLKYQETKINLTNVPTDSSNPLSQIKIKYQAHVSNIGWQAPVYGGAVAGAIGPNYGIEALKIQLEGAPAGYQVWYQAHVQNIGWMEPVTDGAIAGTTGKNLRVEALRIFIVKPGSDSKDTTRIGSISNNGNSITYTYDANGNIRTITQSGKTITYSYNELNEVIREDNQLLNKTMVYSYDAGGNITSKKQYSFTTGTLGTPTSTINYGYGDANWKDKLTSYNGKTITYDVIGNPLNDGTYNYTWEEGKQLQGISGNGKNLNFKYNDAGIRTQKTVNGVTTTYHLDGDLVTYETNGTNQIYYTYDNAGNLLGLNVNGTEYFYIKNIQEDIIGLVDKGGSQVVSYTYDTWGKVISISGSLASTVGELNPYRYRGYRYDTETGLYYLNARYYNPEWGRFINADEIVGSQGELLSANMFAYAQNNPVNMSDSSGNWPSFNSIVKRIKSGISKVVNTFIQQANLARLGIVAAAVMAYEIINFARQPVAFATAGGGASRRISRAASKGISTGANTSKKVAKGTGKIDKTYSRPSGYRKGVKDEVWEKAKGPDDKVRDPGSGKVMNKEEPWDMGHKPGYEFRKHQKSAQERGISRKQFLDEHNNPDHYRPELPSSNRSHKGEDLTDSYFGY